MPETSGRCPVPGCTYIANPSSTTDPRKRLFTHLCQQRKAGCQAHLSFNYTHYRPRVLRTVVAAWTPDQRAAHQRARGRERARRFRERRKGSGGGSGSDGGGGGGGGGGGVREGRGENAEGRGGKDTLQPPPLPPLQNDSGDDERDYDGECTDVNDSRDGSKDRAHAQYGVHPHPPSPPPPPPPPPQQQQQQQQPQKSTRQHYPDSDPEPSITADVDRVVARLLNDVISSGLDTSLVLDRLVRELACMKTGPTSDATSPETIPRSSDECGGIGGGGAGGSRDSGGHPRISDWSDI